jgi:phosphoribosylformimino-5-aminoimidazole carboxamide ribotide isomerase
VGGTLSDSGEGVRTRFEADQSPAWFAQLYRQDQLKGGHVIALGPGNESAAHQALGAWPGGLQYGGGVHADNARTWLDAGASHIIVTSWVFHQGRIDWDRLHTLQRLVGRSRIVLDLSCRLRNGQYWVVTDRWQNFTEVALGPDAFHSLAAFCSEFLVHAVDVEGLCTGIDVGLVQKIADWSPLPATYAGGARSIEDLQTVHRIGQGRVDLTIGSALDLFGGSGVRYADCVTFNRQATANPDSLQETRQGSSPDFTDPSSKEG